MSFENVYEEKARFVKKLQNFYQKECRNIETIKRLDYLHTEQGSEFVYVTYNSNAQKRFCVTADNEQGIAKDFFKYLDHVEEQLWLIPGDAAFVDEFTEDE